uniref:Uncharacterized protein n=1 Tax=Grammatophora oceanica TaxID=210454 RepID=A0A7S1Y6L2_9STRA|mmetsp:Transcript_26256/g.38465  ORF Transcript_26256/g.38465 Transcript_26256/m.38465 type:complete len:1193 (+) Transcript_26256:210-3788(+)
MRAGSPTPQLVIDMEKQTTEVETAASLLRVPSLADVVVVAPTDPEMLGYRLDFEREGSFEQLKSATGGAGRQSGEQQGMVLPRAKSPGYVLLSDILGLRDGGLFGMLEYCLVADGADAGVVAQCGRDSFRHRNAISLFGDLLPSLSTAKGVSAKLNPIHPCSISESTTNDLSRDAKVWREKSVSETLRILCAAAVREEAFISATASSVRLVPMLSFRSKGSTIQASQLQLAKLRDKLSVFQRGQMVPTVTRFIGYSATSDAEDGLLPASALALAAYMCTDYSLDQSMRLLCGPRDTSGYLFTEMVARRLYLSAQRQATSKGHVDVVKLVMSLLRTPVISDKLLGVSPGKTAPGMSRPPETTGCLDVLLNLLENDAFVTDADTSGLASECYEIVSTLVTRTARDKASYMLMERRLESRHFWGRNLERLLLGGRSKPSLLNMFGGGAKSERWQRAVMSSVSWFCRALAQHLGFTVFSRDAVLSPSIDDQTKQILSALFSNHNLCKMFEALPLPAKVPDFPQDLLAYGSVIGECMVPMKGAIAATTGYQMVDVNKLCDTLRSSNSANSSIDKAREWAFEWNMAMEQNNTSFAASHSMVVLLHVGLSSMQSRLGGFQPLQQTQGQLFDLLHLLCDVVTTMNDATSGSQFDSAVNNVALAALLLVDSLCASNMDTTYKALLPSSAMALTQASNHVIHSAEDSNMEAGLILASAVSILLQIDDEMDVSNGFRRVLSKLCVPLARQSCYHEPEARAGPSPGAMLARGALTGLLDFMPPDNDCFPKASANALVTRLGAMDDNIFNLLVKVSRYPNFSQLLLDCNVLKAMKRASRSFQEISSQRMQNHSISSNVSPETTIPSFLQGHLSLLNALLLDANLKPSVTDELCTQTMDLLTENQGVLERLWSQFPNHGFTWMEAVLCLELMASQHGNNHTFGTMARCSHSLVPADFAEMVARVALDLLNHPLPKRFLPVLPSALRGINPDGTLPSEKCWWDAVESADAADGAIILPDPSFTSVLFSRAPTNSHTWSDDKYEAAIAGAKVLERSLAFLVAQCRKSGVVRLEASALSSGICAYTNTTRLVHDRMRELEKLQKGSSALLSGISMDWEVDANRQRMLELELAYLKEVAPVFIRCCERVLTVAHILAGKAGDEDPPYFRNLQKSMTIALDHTKLETLGVGPCKGSFTMAVSKSLRKQLKS